MRDESAFTFSAFKYMKCFERFVFNYSQPSLFRTNWDRKKIRINEHVLHGKYQFGFRKQFGLSQFFVLSKFGI